jgi:DNA-directed RNA polymerase specialized sigma24 family protein
MRLMGVGTQQPDFAEFYRSAADECLRAVLVTPKAWVVRTALNTGISRWRRLRREVPVSDLAAVTDRPAADPAVASPVDPQIMAALMRLPARQRQVVALRLILDLDTNGTAEALGIAPGTVMAHLGRAMAALRQDLQPELRQESRS